MSRSWLNKARLTGNGPVATVIGRRVLYSPQSLELFVASRQQANASTAIGAGHASEIDR